MSHICTTESLYAGGIALAPMECPICCKVTKQIGGYVGIYCTSCKRDWSSEMWRGDVVRMRRNLLGLSRREMGARLEIPYSRIKGYEIRKCPDEYYEMTKEEVKKIC